VRFEIVIFDGFDEMDLFGVFEALRMAKFDVPIKTIKPTNQVTAIYGTKLIPDGVLDIVNRPDVLIVPGGGWLVKAEHGAWAEAQKGDLPKALQSIHKAGTVLASVCTGSMLLAKAGLLKGRPATTNRGAMEELSASGVNVVKSRVVDDGDIITAGGITASLDLGLWLVEKFASVEKAIDVSQKLEFESRGPVWISAKENQHVR
jgi:transcriptional regulator GlxA family with amidase domain